MKKLSCKQLGGACDQEIAGATFAEIGRKCREHVMERIKAGDAAHIAAADKMSRATPEQQKTMMTEYEKRFNAASKA